MDRGAWWAAVHGVFLRCWRLCVVCLALELVGSWVVLGFSVGMEVFDKLLSINVPWSHLGTSYESLEGTGLFHLVSCP